MRQLLLLSPPATATVVLVLLSRSRLHVQLHGLLMGSARLTRRKAHQQPRELHVQLAVGKRCGVVSGGGSGIGWWVVMAVADAACKLSSFNAAAMRSPGRKWGACTPGSAWDAAVGWGQDCAWLFPVRAGPCCAWGGQRRCWEEGWGELR